MVMKKKLHCYNKLTGVYFNLVKNGNPSNEYNSLTMNGCNYRGNRLLKQNIGKLPRKRTGFNFKTCDPDIGCHSNFLNTSNILFPFLERKKEWDGFILEIHLYVRTLLIRYISGCQNTWTNVMLRHIKKENLFSPYDLLNFKKLCYFSFILH